MITDHGKANVIRHGTMAPGSEGRILSLFAARDQQVIHPFDLGSRSRSSSAMLLTLQLQLKSMASGLASLKQAQVAEETEPKTKISPK